MKLVVSIGLILFSSNVLFSQRTLSTDVWHDGLIVTNENDTIQGLIKYNLETGVVQYTDGRRINEAFTAKTLVFFQIQDKLLDATRRFYSLPYSMIGNYESLQLFEVLIEGKLNLLAREKREVINKSDYYWGYYYTYGQEVLKPEYYLLLQTGRITSFSGKKRDFLDFVGPKKAVLMKEFINEDGLNTNKRADLAKIITYYNILK